VMNINIHSGHFMVAAVFSLRREVGPVHSLRGCVGNFTDKLRKAEFRVGLITGTRAPCRVPNKNELLKH